MNFCLDSVDLKKSVHYCANQIILNISVVAVLDWGYFELYSIH